MAATDKTAPVMRGRTTVVATADAYAKRLSSTSAPLMDAWGVPDGRTT